MPRKPAKPGSRQILPAEEQPLAGQEAGDWLARHVRQDLSMIGSLVRYADHMEYEDPETGETCLLGADEFTSLARLALLDAFMRTMDDAEKVEILMAGEKRDDRKPERLQSAREHPKYQDIHDQFLDVARAFGPKRAGIEAWAEELEDLASREIAATALFAPGQRDRLQALDELVARRSAKKGREAGGRQFRLPDEFIALLSEASEIVRQKRSSIDAEYEISASRPNVPEIPEEAGE